MNTVPTPEESFLLKEHSNLSDDVIFAFQPQENKLLFLSAAFEKIWGMNRDTVDSDFSALFNTIHPDDRVLLDNALADMQQTKNIKKLELRLQLPGEVIKWISIDAYLSQYNGVNTIIGTAIDISVHKEYGNTIYRYVNKKNAILDILSHDLVSPISNIKACAQVLLERITDGGDAVLHKLINMIIDDSDRSVRMIRDLINREVLDATEDPLVMQRTNIVERLAEVIEQYKSSYTAVKQKIELESAAENLYITVDESKFIQIINNLLSNALKFTRDTDTIKVIVEDKQATVLIKVVDSGIGIPADLQPFIFDKFTKARRPGIHGELTTGLGLSLIKTIVDWHKGDIWFESKEGEGTTFFVELPKDRP